MNIIDDIILKYLLKSRKPSCVIARGILPTLFVLGWGYLILGTSVLTRWGYSSPGWRGTLVLSWPGGNPVLSWLWVPLSWSTPLSRTVVLPPPQERIWDQRSRKEPGTGVPLEKIWHQRPGNKPWTGAPPCGYL